MAIERVVAFGFLTDRDLEVLGREFTRHFPIDDDDLFADLIAQLDGVEVEPLGRGVVIRPPAR